MKTAILVLAFAALLALGHAQFGKGFSSGYITVNKQFDANLFYYFVPSQGNPATDPIILWLQGGPGCSSMFGSWVENGPFLVQKDGTFKANPYTWNTNASMIWIDSPVGTGFSYVKGDNYATDEQTIANDLYIALQQFLFQLQPSYSANPFYIFGESYGGKYVPWLASTVLKNNQSPKSGKKINLKGIGIGNGWVDPYYQTASYGPFLYANSRINVVELDAAEAAYLAYAAAIDAGLYDVAMILGNDMLNALMAAAGVNDVYEIRQKSDPTIPFANKLQVFLNSAPARKALNVTSNVHWALCDTSPYFALMGDIDRESVQLVPGILAKIPVLLYNGNFDLICNWMGTQTWSNDMAWPGSKAFASAPNTTWAGASGQNGGWYKSAAGLTRLIVANAGHMSPFDQPANVQVMVWQFLTGGFKVTK